MVEALLVRFHVQEPAEQQVVVELLAKQPLTANRVQRHQQRGLEQSLGRYRRPSHATVHLVENRRQLLEHPVGYLLDTPQRMSMRYLLLHIHPHQHRPLLPLFTAHPPLPPTSPQPHSLPKTKSITIGFRRFSTAFSERE